MSGAALQVRATHPEGACAQCDQLRTVLASASGPTFARFSEGSACVAFAEYRADGAS